MALEAEDKQLIIEKKAINSDFTAEELAYAIREERSTPVTTEEVREYLDREDTQRRIETKQSYLEKNASYTRQQLINEMVDAKETIVEMRDELRDASKAKSMVEASGELRKTLELLGKTIDALKDEDSQGDQYIRIDELHVEDLATALDDADVETLVEHKDGLRIEKEL